MTSTPTNPTSPGSCLAIIPARGGSKGIPHKNIRQLAGKPLLAWTIEAARAAQQVTRVVVSTDDPQIRQIALQYGAEVVLRPSEISGDTASSESALLHTLDYLKTTENYQPELVAFLQCTSPLMLPADIDGTIQALRQDQADSAFSAIRFFHFIWKREADGATGINHDKKFRQRRQERTPEYLENGAVYVFNTQEFLQAKHRFFGKTAIYEIPPSRSLEIDEPGDLEMAEFLLQRSANQAKTAHLPRPVHAVVFDFDGVFTDNRVLVDENGVESVMCNRSDGMGLIMLRQAGVPLLVISKEENPVVSARCRKLGIECIQKCDDKLPVMKKWLAERQLTLASTIYMGNDINDLACLEAAGCGVIVADAHPAVRPAAQLVLTNPGGFGAIRELCDLVLQNLNS